MIVINGVLIVVSTIGYCAWLYCVSQIEPNIITKMLVCIGFGLCYGTCLVVWIKEIVKEKKRQK
ncbi:MAG: hypothetical protein A2W75_02705 [Nitrospinae bacterium RIFCSPLOWO2_12_39_15]|nr:MAG: hypothetical protein A2W75_02705 [Nitrospinae bacterium RIFCSPLOWO2_12_39_15]